MIRTSLANQNRCVFFVLISLFVGGFVCFVFCFVLFVVVVVFLEGGGGGG